MTKDLYAHGMSGCEGDRFEVIRERIAARKPLGTAGEVYVYHPDRPAASMYENRIDRLGLEFVVERPPFDGCEAVDPRIVRIPPGKVNERHRHAHESVFVILAGSGCIEVGGTTADVTVGSVVFAPRWQVHQTRNTGEADLVMLAVTDFNLTSAVLGDYDKRTRMTADGEDSGL